LTKWGTGNLTIDTAQTSTGDLRIEEGTLTLSGAAGQTAFGIIRPAKGAELVLNNSNAALENRLGGKNINGQGGTVRLIGGSTAVTETIGQLNNGSTVGDLSFLNIQSGSAPTNILITTIERFDNAGGRQSTWVLRGPGMAGLPGTYGADTAYTPNPANPTTGLFRATNPNFFSNVGLGQQTGTMQGYIGTPLVPVRGDLLGDLNPNGAGTGFVTQESATTGFRLLAASEYQDYFHFGTGGNNAVNVKLTAPVTGIGGDTRIATLTMANNASVTLGSTLPLNQTPSRLIINAGGILVQPGANASINAPYLQVLGGVALSMHTQGNLAVNATIFSDTSVVKTGPGTLTFAPGTAGIWRGTFTIDEGTVNLGVNNSFFVTRNQNGFTGQSVHLNGGALNLNGNSQMINALNSSNILPGFGGVLSSASVASLIIQGGGAFSGSIQGAISLDKVANNTCCSRARTTILAPRRFEEARCNCATQARSPRRAVWSW
jgi:autotransporter-associated beta strand protein